MCLHRTHEVGEQMMTSGHQRTNYEVDVVSKTNRVLTLETSNKLITKGSQPIGIQGIARDISTCAANGGGTARGGPAGSFRVRTIAGEDFRTWLKCWEPRVSSNAIFRGLRDFTRVVGSVRRLFCFALRSNLRTFEPLAMHGATAKSSMFRTCRRCL